MSSKYLSSMEIDAIGEIQNISLGSSATAVSTMLNARVEITTPLVSIVSKEDFTLGDLDPAVCVEITYIEGLTGNNIMLLKREDVKSIVEMLMGIEIPEEEFELNEINISAICEVMNQMMGASSTALSELLSKPINISTPSSFEVKDIVDFKNKYFQESEPMVIIRFNISIADKMESEFMNMMPISLARELVGGFFPGGFTEEEEKQSLASASDSDTMSQEEIEKLMNERPKEVSPVQADRDIQKEENGSVMSQNAVENLMNDMNTTVKEQTVTGGIPEQPYMQQQMEMPGAPVNGMLQQMITMMQQQMEMQQSQITQLQKEVAAGPKSIRVNQPPRPNLENDEMEPDPDANVDLIMGVALDVSVEIGRTQKLVKDILELNRGSLVVLDKLAGEQVDVFVNGECIAKGDVVVVEDNFGVRITEILKHEIEV